MSRPNQSRPLGKTSKPAPAAPKAPGSSSGPVPRRSAGTLPGIARTASTLRQLSSSPGGPNTLASLPAHLRNLSAPRIPSPLGQGTPGRALRQSFPARTSKTTEKHVFLPEDPQLAPLPTKTPGVAPPERPGRARSHSSSSLPHHGSSTQLRSALLNPYDEQSDAEKMTKRERQESGLPRLTAYNTAEGYRLKLLQAFLKREHGVGVVRVYDDCVYAVYNLPLLPGYGAGTRVRSSPAVKSPGGMSMQERMTLAEEAGYEEEYFPVIPDEASPAVTAPHDPSEYILSHSPPAPMHIQEPEPSMETIMEQPEENAVSPTSSDGVQRASQSMSVSDSNGSNQESERGRDEEVVVYQGGHELGTHMSPTHPGFLEHVPSSALSPSELQRSTERRRRYPSPPKRRRDRSSNQVAEAVFFSYGVSVFFGFQAEEEREIMADCEAAGVWQQGLNEDDWEVEEFHYIYDEDAESPRIYNDMFTFKSRSHLFKLSLAHAIAQSTKLSVFESAMQESLELTSTFPKELSTTGHLQMDRIQALKLTGRLFKLRMDVNLISGVLDTPELFWSEASLYPLYEAINQYLEIGPRVQVLNDRLAVVGDLLEIIHDYIDQRATHRITWIIIWLIVVACVVAFGEVLARLVFHNIARGDQKIAMVAAARAMLGKRGGERRRAQCGPRSA